MEHRLRVAMLIELAQCELNEQFAKKVLTLGSGPAV